MADRKTTEELFWAKVDKNGPYPAHVPGIGNCWVWTACVYRKLGYGKFGFKGRTLGAHQAAWVLTWGNYVPGSCTLHRCDNRLCVRPSHLYQGTRADNAHDRDRKGRTQKGDRHYTRLRPELCGASKLTDEYVLRMAVLAFAGWTFRVLGEKFNVSRGAARRAVGQETWRHLGVRTDHIPGQRRK